MSTKTLSRRQRAIERDRRRARMAQAYLRGLTQQEIAAEIGVDQATVSRDLDMLSEEWRRTTSIDFIAAKARELARIDHLEREYWAAWDRSCAPFKSVILRGNVMSGPGWNEALQARRVERVEYNEDRCGDPRYLAGVQWCIEQRCKIYGLYAPARYDHDVNSGGKPIQPVQFIEVIKDYSDPIEPVE